MKRICLTALFLIFSTPVHADDIAEISRSIVALDAMIQREMAALSILPDTDGTLRELAREIGASEGSLLVCDQVDIEYDDIRQAAERVESIILTLSAGAAQMDDPFYDNTIRSGVREGCGYEIDANEEFTSLAVIMDHVEMISLLNIEVSVRRALLRDLLSEQ